MTDIPPQIFANQEDQASWIIEDILISSLKLPDLKQKYGQFLSPLTFQDQCYSFDS